LCLPRLLLTLHSHLLSRSLLLRLLLGRVLFARMALSLPLRLLLLRLLLFLRTALFALLIDLRLLRGNLPLVMTYARALLAYSVSYAFLYGYSQWIQEGRGLSPALAGLAQLPLFAVAVVVAITTGRRTEVRSKLLVGASTQIAACALLLLLDSTSPFWLLLAVAVVFGVPQGLNNLALQNSVYHQADPERIGSSSGLLRTFGYLGAITASAASGSFFSERADTAGLHELTWFMIGAAVLFLVVTVADRALARIGAAGTTASTHPAPARHEDVRSDRGAR